MEKNKTLDVYGIVYCALFTALIAIGAFIKIPLPHIPNTLQFLFTNLAGLMLGRKRGLIAVCLYIFIGLTGIPVFAAGGGIDYIFRPTFGYIIGFAVGTWLAGYITERKVKTTKTYILAGLANMAVVYSMGLIYFYLMSNLYLDKSVNIEALLLSGVVYCAPGDIFYCIVSGILVKRLQPILTKRKAKT